MGFATAPAPHGWGLPATKAQLHWQEIVDNPKNKPMFGRRGGEKIKLYPCETKLFMRQAQGSKTGKVVHNEFESKKKASDEDRARLKRKVFKDHEADLSSDDDGLTNVLMQSAEAGQNAFEGVGMGVDIQSTFIDAPFDETPKKKRKGEVDDPSEAGKSASAGGGATGSNVGGPGGTPRGKAAPKTKAKAAHLVASDVAKAETTFSDKISNLHDDVSAMVMDATAKLDYYTGHREASHYASLIAISESRLTVLKLTNESDSKRLRSALTEIRKRQGGCSIDPRVFNDF